MPSSTDIESASLNHHPTAEAGPAPFARWLHKGGSHQTRLLTSLDSVHLLQFLNNHPPLKINEPVTAYVIALIIASHSISGDGPPTLPHLVGSGPI